MKDAKTAVISGITGQDGSYLAELLLAKGYKVYGLVRRSSTLVRPRIDHLHLNSAYKDRLTLLYSDVTDSHSMSEIVSNIKPDEFYNLAAQSHVKISWDMPEFTSNVTGVAPVRILEAIRQLSPKTRFYQASSSEQFGKVVEVPQTEHTRFYPRSPYGCAKVFAHHITVNYRESYGLFACCGILFNHESERRGDNFVTKKIAISIARIARGEEHALHLGNMDAKRDWGYAPDYVHAMWLMLQQEKPEDYVIATGETHTVREFVEEGFRVIGKEIVWEGEEANEVGKDAKTGKVLVRVDPKFYRPAEVDLLIGDITKARKQLQWEPTVKFKELVRIMVNDCIQDAKPSMFREL